jgi:hypothetical protein
MAVMDFICADCGCRVYSWRRAKRPPLRCGICEWVAEYVDDPEEAERIRQRLRDD